MQFEDVTFEYNPGVPVLKHVSFHRTGRLDDGAGGFERFGQEHADQPGDGVQPAEPGRVLVDGQDLTTVKLRDFRSHLGVVLQDNFLFDGTIAENIAYAQAARHARGDQGGQPDRALRRVHRASSKSGYDTIVGERGVRLSGGQRQRVAIARAILANPRILILDEATSSLDSESEALIQDGLKSLRQGRTTFVIAHRLSTIRSVGSDPGARAR